MTIAEKTEKIFKRMFSRRLDPELRELKDWKFIQLRPPIKAKDVIEGHLTNGDRVTAGYYTTGVRGYHEHYIFWKEKKYENR
jgi:hypothetical protein